MSLRLVEVRRDQLVAVHDLVHRAYRGESARRGWTHEADLLDGQRTDLDALAEMVDDPAQHLLVTWSGDRPLACIAITQKSADLVYIGLVTVDPVGQGAGTGRSLLAAAERFAATRLGAHRAEMTVITARNELVQWYERRGYVLTGERRPFPHGDPRFGLPLRDDLEFAVLEKTLTASGSACP